MENEKITTKLALRLAKYAAETKARLSTIPNNMVIVMDDEIREELVSGYLSAFQDGAAFILETLNEND